MKTKSILLILVLATFSISLKAQLKGKKFELKMEQMGTFYLEFQETDYLLTNPMGDVAVKGTYQIQGATISFIDKEGQMACPENQIGKYKFTYKNKELKMELIEDECTGRPNMASQTWNQVEK